MAVAFGVHPIHLGVIFLANLELGYLTPPVGLNLYLAASRFDKPLTTVVRTVLPVPADHGGGGAADHLRAADVDRRALQALGRL